MKRLMILTLLFCVLTLSVFAQINVGGYAKSYWIPYRLTIPTEGDTQQTTAVQAPWGEPDLSAGINVDAWSEWGGFHLGVGIANGAKNISANAESATGGGWVWVKPFGNLESIPVMESFTIFLGTPNDDHLAGKIGGSNLSTYVLNASWELHNHRIEIQDPQYNTFTRFNPYAWGNADKGTQNLFWPRVAAAAMITWEPIENLFIGAFVAPEIFKLADGGTGPGAWADGPGGGYKVPVTEPMNDGDENPDNDNAPLGGGNINQDYYNVKDVYRKTQFGIGYTFPGIGFARAQYIGIRNTVEVAFQLTALGDLIFDIGAKIPFEGTDKKDLDTYKRRKDFQASIAATYRNYNFRLLGRVDAAFAGSDSSKREVIVNGLNLIAYLVPSYQLDIGTVGMDFGFEYEQADDFNTNENDSMQAGAALWLSRSLGNATFKVAAVTRFPLWWYGSVSSKGNLPAYWNGGKTTMPFEVFFPIILEVGF